MERQKGFFYTKDTQDLVYTHWVERQEVTSVVHEVYIIYESSIPDLKTSTWFDLERSQLNINFVLNRGRATEYRH